MYVAHELCCGRSGIMSSVSVFMSYGENQVFFVGRRAVEGMPSEPVRGWIKCGTLTASIRF